MRDYELSAICSQKKDSVLCSRWLTNIIRLQCVCSLWVVCGAAAQAHCAFMFAAMYNKHNSHWKCFFQHCDSFKGNKYKQCIIQCILLYYIDRNPTEFKFLKNFVVLPPWMPSIVALFIQNVLFLPLPIAKKSCIDFETQ